MGEMTASFGAWLRHRRKTLGLTQDELAQRAGYSLGAIRKLEADERRPSPELAARLADALQVPSEERAAFLKVARAERAVDGFVLTPAVAPPSGHRHGQMPVPLTRLIGREREVAALVARLRGEEVRLVTLTGPGGVGKTRLALQVAADLVEDFPDGVYFVDLAPVRDSNFVIGAIAQTVGVREGGGQQLASLKHYLRDKRMLLVLDNFEHLLAAAPLVAELLASTAQPKVLATSRERLHLRGEQELAVSPLALPVPDKLPPVEQLAKYAAVALFLAHARAVDSAFQLTDANAPVVAEICLRLDGLPLAIELAAGRIKLFSPAALLQRLERRLTTVVGGARDLPLRQQTLRNTIDWSYKLLVPAEQQLFARLAVFTGGWGIETAEAVCNPHHDLGTDSMGILAALVDKSFVRSIELPDGEHRFSMLETLHEYALEQLSAWEGAALLRRQHCDHFLQLAEAAEQQLEGPDQIRWFEQVEREHSNLRTALVWCQADPARKRQGLRLAAALGQFWSIRGYVNEGREWLRAALAQTEESEAEPVRIKALLAAGTMAEGQGDYEAARIYYEEGLRISSLLADPTERARALRKLGGLAYSQGSYERAMALHETSLELFQEVADQGEIGRTLWTIGVVAIAQGDHARARSIFQDRIAEHRRRGNKLGLAGALTNLGVVAQTLRDYIQAEHCHRESLPLYRQLGDQDGIALALLNLGFVAYCQGDYRLATTHYVESCVLHQKIGDQEGSALSLIGLAAVAAAQAQGRRAARLLGAGEAIMEAIGAVVTASEGDVEPEQVAAAVRVQLGEAVFLHEWAEGRVMGPRAALEQTPE